MAANMSRRSAGAAETAAGASHSGSRPGPADDAQAQGQLASGEIDRFLLSALLENTADQIYFKDIESRFIRVSTAQALKLGLAGHDDAIGKTDFDVFSREHARQAFEDEQRIIHSGIPMVGLEEKETWANGREAWVSTSKLPLRDDSGAVIGTFGVSRDITLEKVQRDELARQADQLRAALALAEKTQQNLEAALGELHLAQEERLKLLARTVEVSEEERRRIAADLHDGPIQKITATALTIDLLVAHLARGKDDVDALAEGAGPAHRRNHVAATADGRALPPILGERGIAAAISAGAAELLPPKTSYTVHDRTAAIRFAPDVETVVHRITREALINVQRHARATRVEVDIDHVGDNLQVRIADDGVSFDPGRSTPAQTTSG